MEKNVLLTIAYDGSRFHGWQKQPGELTVQGHLEKVISQLFKREILLSGTSRTDAGVHALGQRASFKADLGIPTEKMAMVINNALCAAENAGGYAKAPVRILEAAEMPMDFHARFNCKSKEYIYRIIDGTSKTGRGRDKADSTAADNGKMAAFARSLVFDRNYVYHVKETLDLEAMKKAAGLLEGTQDFKSFEASGSNPRETTVRTILSAGVYAVQRQSGAVYCGAQSGAANCGAQAGEATCGAQSAATNCGAQAGEATCGSGFREIEFHVRGDGFLYNMVRIITGTLVEIGQGKRKPEEITEIIEAKDRAKAGHTAPPNGLYLAEVFYEQAAAGTGLRNGDVG